MEQAEISQLMAGVSPELAQKLQADDSIGSVLRKVKDYDSDKLLNVLNLLITLSESEREEIRRVMQGMEEEERGMPEVLEMTEAGKAEELTESERGILTGADDEGQWMVVDMKSNEIDVAASIVNMNNVLKGKLPVKAASGKRLVRWQEYVDDKKKAQSQDKEEGGEEQKDEDGPKIPFNIDPGQLIPADRKALREAIGKAMKKVEEGGKVCNKYDKDHLFMAAENAGVDMGRINFNKPPEFILIDILEEVKRGGFAITNAFLEEIRNIAPSFQPTALGGASGNTGSSGSSGRGASGASGTSGRSGRGASGTPGTPGTPGTLNKPRRFSPQVYVELLSNLTEKQFNGITFKLQVHSYMSSGTKLRLRAQELVTLLFKQYP